MRLLLFLVRSAVCFGIALHFGLGQLAAQPQVNIAPQADQVLRAASRYLAEPPYFTCSAEIWRERVSEAGQKLQFTRRMDLEVKRPNALHATLRSALTDRSFWDENGITVYWTLRP